MKSKLFYLVFFVFSFMFFSPLGIATDPENSGNIEKQQTSNYCICKSKPDYYVEVALKEIYVTVKDKDGRHISDLKPDEFKLWEDGVPQNILAVDKVDFIKKDLESTKYVDTTETAPSTTGKDSMPKRYFTLLIGNLPELKVERERSRTAILNFINNVIQPTDFISLYILTPSNIKLVVPFDIDPQKSRSSVLNFLQTEDFASGGFKSTRRGRLGWLDDDEHIKNFDFLRVCNSLTVLCNSLQYISGKKDVILFSEGFYFNPDWEIELNPPKNDSPEEFMKNKLSPSPATLVRKLLDLKETFNQHDISLQVIDLGNTKNMLSDVSERAIEPTGTYEREHARTAALKTLSGASGGKFYSYANTANKINEGLKSVDYDTSFYYILSYTSSTENDAGTYLPIKVEVSRDDATLGYKKGVVVRENFKNLNETEQNAQLNYIIQSSILYNMISMCSDVVVLPGEDKNSDLIFGIQLPLDEIAVAGKKGDKVDLDVFLYVFNNNNETISSFERHLEMNLKKSDQKKKKTKLGFYYSTSMAAGKYRVRFFVRNRDNMLISSEEYKVNVPDFSGSKLILSSPLLYKDTPEVAPINLNASAKEEEKKDTELKSVIAHLPGLHSISDETNNHKKIKIGVAIKGLTGKEILTRGNGLITWQAVKQIPERFTKEPPVNLKYEVADIIEKSTGTFLTLFELDMRDLPKGGYETEIQIAKDGKTASSSIKIQII
jgi:VWFA-related protein